MIHIKPQDWPTEPDTITLFESVFEGWGVHPQDCFQLVITKRYIHFWVYLRNEAGGFYQNPTPWDGHEQAWDLRSFERRSRIAR